MKYFRLRLVTVLPLLVVLAVHAADQPVFDVHIHYSHDVWDKLSPKEAIAKLREIGITRAMVSSSGNEGTLRLYREAPDMIIPVLRPYHERDDIDTWMADDRVLPYLEKQLAKHKYAAIGEFHLWNFQADDPIPRGLVQLAREHNLIMHAHIDANGLKRLFNQDPDARILWAHAGFEDAPVVRKMMEHYDNLWADLSYRYEVFENGEFGPDWKDLLVDYSDRFMLGVDPYTPETWLEMKKVMNWYDSMFDELPPEVAEKIRYKNAERVIKWK